MATGHELVAQIFPLHSPKDERIAAVLDEIRREFIDVADDCVDWTAVTPEQTIAIRKTHEAMQAWITAVVLYQEGVR